MLPKSFEFVNNFKKYKGNPIIRPQGYYAADCIFNPGAVVKDGKVEMICRCINFAMPKPEKNWSVSSLVWAHSEDGVNFTLDEKPFLSIEDGSKYKGGYEDPRLVFIEDKGIYVLTYTGVIDYNNTVGMLAISKDLKNWEFMGECFPGRAIAITNKKIGGKYWAYFGNSSIFSAWSDDLKIWHTENKAVLTPRENTFDATLCEAVASPIITDDGILLLYNGANRGEYRRNFALSIPGSFRACIEDTMYGIGWALFDRNNPEKLIDRSTDAFLKPTEPYESYGIAEYTAFGNALVHFKGKYFLYYGCSDTRISVAISE